MKRHLTKLLTVGSIALLMLSACKKDGTQVTSNGGKPGALTASATTLVLDKTKLNDPSTAITFNFTKADYGFNAAITNTLQIDSAGDNWKNPISVTLDAKKGSLAYNTADFNTMLLKLKLTGGVTAQVKVRLQHTVSAQVTPVYSNELALTVTPFNLTSYLYTVGAYQGWDINHQDSLLSATSNGVYIGVLNFTAGNNQFLIVPKRNSYDNKYATNDAQGSTSATVAVNAANNLYAPAAAGYYTVTLNINTNTISFAPFVPYYSIIGDGALGWDPTGDDVDMKSANDGTGLWTVTVDLKSSGTIKIRKSHDWTISYGIAKTSPDGKTLYSDNDDNIPVPSSGTYKITFLPTADDKTAAYTMVKQ